MSGATSRKTRSGSIVVPASELQVGDRMEFHGGRQHAWFPIQRIEEISPKFLRLTLRVGIDAPQFRVKRTTLVGRAPRADER